MSRPPWREQRIAREEQIEFARQQVLSEGRTEGEQHLLLRQLHVKFGELPDAVVERVHVASEPQLTTNASSRATRPHKRPRR